MNWNRNCNLNDDISKLHTLVIQSDYFGEDHAHNLFHDTMSTSKETDESAVSTTEDNKVDKFLVGVLKQIKKLEQF